MSLNSVALFVFVTVFLGYSPTATANREEHTDKGFSLPKALRPDFFRPRAPAPKEEPPAAEAEKKQGVEKLLKEIREKAARLDGAELLKTFKAKHARTLEKMEDFAKELVKTDKAKVQNLDPLVSVALAVERKRLLTETKKLIEALEKGDIDKDETNIKQLIAEEIMALDMDSMLIPFGMEMLKASQDPAVIKKFDELKERPKQAVADELTRLHTAAALAVQTTYRKEIQDNWTTKPDSDMAKASVRARNYSTALSEVFADKVDEIRPATTTVTLGLLRTQYAPSIIELYGPKKAPK